MMASQEADTIEAHGSYVGIRELRVRLLFAVERGVEGRTRKRLQHRQDDALGASPLRHVVVHYCDGHNRRGG